MSRTATVLALVVRVVERVLDALAEERAVRQLGERVVQRLVLLLGCVQLQRVGLTAQAPRGAGDDPEQDQPHHADAGEEQQVHGPRLVADLLGDRRVGQEEVDRSGGAPFTSSSGT